MIAAWPLADRNRVVHAFRPGERAAAEGPFRTLRAHSWASSGVRVNRRTGGRLVGRSTVFSSLNVESARCARHGNRDAAARLARAAAQLEGGPEFAELGRLLAELPELEMAGVVAGVVPEDAPAALADALRAVARRTEEFREHELGPTGPVEVIAGTIAEVHEGYVLLVRFGGPAAVVPRWMAVAARRTEVGELLALVMDKLDEASAVVEALPAIDVGSGGDTFTPFGRTDARVRSMTAEDERLLTGEPEAPRVVLPITIER